MTDPFAKTLKDWRNDLKNYYEGLGGVDFRSSETTNKLLQTIWNDQNEVLAVTTLRY